MQIERLLAKPRARSCAPQLEYTFCSTSRQSHVSFVHFRTSQLPRGVVLEVRAVVEVVPRREIGILSPAPSARHRHRHPRGAVRSGGPQRCAQQGQKQTQRAHAAALQP